MSGVAVLVPWAGSCPYRVASWNYVRSWYENHYPSWSVIQGSSNEGAQWCKAEAVARALRRTHEDILVIADADCIAQDVGRAVREVADGTPWAVPHHKLYRLNEVATKDLIRGGDLHVLAASRDNLTQAPYPGYVGGGITVMHRQVYESAPLDPRFRGWGQEDESWAIALKVLHGKPWRSTGPMWHLWHPPQQRMSRTTGSFASRDLLQQYRRISSRSGMQRFLKPACALLDKSQVRVT